MENRPKVFIPNANKFHLYDSVDNYGKTVKLTEGNINKNKVSLLYRKMDALLKESSSRDWILLSGPVIANVVATSIFAAKYRRLNLLIYQKNGGYLKRNIKL